MTYPSGSAAEVEVLILLDSSVQPAWVQSVVDAFVGDRHIRVQGIVICPTKPTKKEGLWYRAYRRLDRRRFQAEPDALIQSTLIVPPSVPIHRADWVGSTLSDHAGSELFPDVALWLGDADIPAGVPPPARYGLWYLRFGQGGPAGFNEVVGRQTHARIELLAIKDNTPRCLDCSITGVDQRSPHLTENALRWKGVAMLEPRRFCRLTQQQRSSTVHGEQRAEPEAADGRASRLGMMRALTEMGLRYIEHRNSNRRYREQWQLVLRWHLNGGSPKQVVIEPDPLHAYADPFVICRDDRYFVYFEEYKIDEGRGRIMVAEVDEDGLVDEPAPALDLDHHLSYPFLFTWKGELFMMPECYQQRGVELYVCNRFPDQWVHHSTVIEDVDAVDPTIVEHEGRFWLFTTVRPRRGLSYSEDLWLFMSDTPLGPWSPHPANPVKSDVRSARPAGGMFFRGESMLRPSQDCSRRYGYSVVINRVRVLDNSQFVEEPIDVFLPTGKSVLGQHTFNSVGRLEVRDRLVRVPR